MKDSHTSRAYKAKAGKKRAFEKEKISVEFLMRVLTKCECDCVCLLECVYDCAFFIVVIFSLTFPLFSTLLWHMSTAHIHIG